MSLRRVRMMIMLRIPENKHKPGSAQRLLHGCAALMLCNYMAPTNTLLWLGEEVLSHQQRQKQNPKE